MVRLKASAEPTSGLAVPARTATPSAERATIGARVGGDLALRCRVVDGGRHQQGGVERLAGIDLALEDGRVAYLMSSLAAAGATPNCGPSSSSISFKDGGLTTAISAARAVAP